MSIRSPGIRALRATVGATKPPASPRSRGMEIPIAVLADSANVSQEGTLNILGIFSAIRSRTFPAHHPHCVLVLQLQARRSEQGQHERIVVRLMDLDNV